MENGTARRRLIRAAQGFEADLAAVANSLMWMAAAARLTL